MAGEREVTVEGKSRWLTRDWVYTVIPQSSKHVSKKIMSDEQMDGTDQIRKLLRNMLRKNKKEKKE